MSPGEGAQPPPLNESCRASLAADLRLLAALHDHALQRRDLVSLWGRCYDGLLRLAPKSPGLRQAQNAFCEALTQIPTCVDGQTENALRKDHWRMRSQEQGVPPDIATGLEKLVEALKTASRPPDQQIERDLVRVSRERRSASSASLAACLAMLAGLVADDGFALPGQRLLGFISPQLIDWTDRLATDSDGRCVTPVYRELAGLTVCYLRDVEALLRSSNPAADMGDPAGIRSAPQIATQAMTPQ